MKALLKFFLLFYFCLMCVGCDSPARLASADLRSSYVFIAIHAFVHIVHSQ